MDGGSACRQATGLLSTEWRVIFTPRKGRTTLTKQAAITPKRRPLTRPASAKSDATAGGQMETAKTFTKRPSARPMRACRQPKRRPIEDVRWTSSAHNTDPIAPPDMDTIFNAFNTY